MADELPIDHVDKLYDALTRDDHITLCSILDNQPDLINTATADLGRSMTPLMQACWTGSTRSVNILLQRGADVCGTGKMSITNRTSCEVYRTLGGYGGLENTFPLYIAALRGYLDVVQVLLTNGADVNQVTCSGQAALHCACFLGELDDLWSRGHSSVCYEVKDTRIDDFTLIVIHLIESGANINARDNNGRTPLHFACRYGSPQMVKFLIDKGAAVTSKDNYGHSILEIAALYETGTFDVLFESHEWTEEEIVNAYEITGDIEYMMEATLRREELNYPKKIAEPVEYYKFTKEWDSLLELEEEGDDLEWVWIQSRLARERVFEGRHIHFECEFTEPEDALSRSQEVSILARHCLDLCRRNNDHLYFVSMSSATGQLLNELTMERELDALETGTVMEFIGLAMECATKMKDALEKELQLGHVDDLICQLERSLEVIGDLISIMIERRRSSKSFYTQDDKNDKDNKDYDFIEANLRRLLYKIPCVYSSATGYRRQLLHILISKKYEAIMWNYYLRLPDPEMVRILLKQGLDINAVDCDKNTLLHVVVNLFSAQKDLFARESLPEAILKITGLLLESGIDIHAKNRWKKTALGVIQTCSHYKKALDSDMHNCISLIQQYEEFPTLKNIVVHNLHRYNIAYHNYLPDVLIEYVNQH